jgi:hypothetical protein
VMISVESADILERALFGEPEPPPPPPAPEPPRGEPQEVWIGVKTKEKFVKKAMPLIEMNLRPDETLRGLAEVNTELLAITDQRAFTMKTYGSPTPLVSLLSQEMRQVSFEGSPAKINIETTAGVDVQLCKTYTKDDVAKILELLRRLVPATPTQSPTATVTQSEPPDEVKYWGKFKDKELQVAMDFINASLQPGEHVHAMLNTISRWIVLTDQRVFMIKTVAPKKFEEVAALDQLESVTIIDKFTGAQAVLQTRAGMRIELTKTSDRAGLVAIVGEVQRAIQR